MYIAFLGSSSLGHAACSFFTHPLRVLNDIFDPSKATSARPRKLGLWPQTVRVRPVGRFLRPRRVPKNIVRAAPGTCGVGVNLNSAIPRSGKDRKTHILPFQMPLHPMNRFAHKHGKVEKTEAATKPGRHGRARSPGEGKCCDARKGLLSVPAIMPCAEL
jgi:hypothetical protein